MRDALLGRWSVVSWYQAYDDGHVVYPFGEDPTGFIDYQDAGYMCCTIARSGRANFETGGQWNASAAEKAAAYDSYLSYSGTFDVWTTPSCTGSGSPSTPTGLVPFRSGSSI